MRLAWKLQPHFSARLQFTLLQSPGTLFTLELQSPSTIQQRVKQMLLEEQSSPNIVEQTKASIWKRSSDALKHKVSQMESNELVAALYLEKCGVPIEQALSKTNALYAFRGNYAEFSMTHHRYDIPLLSPRLEAQFYALGERWTIFSEGAVLTSPLSTRKI
jgi:hypothetical protein